MNNNTPNWLIKQLYSFNPAELTYKEFFLIGEVLSGFNAPYWLFVEWANQNPPSPFAMGEENYTRIGNISKSLQWEADMYIRSHCGRQISDKVFNTGDTVKHPAFGTGEIIYSDNAQGKYEVYFNSIASKNNILRKRLMRLEGYCFRCLILPEKTEK